MNSENVPPDPLPDSSAADAAQRVATIIDAAERAAASVVEDAEARAQRILEEARERADGIVSERLRELADQLDSATAGERQIGHLKPVEAPLGQPVEPVGHSGSAGARLLATQMAVSGASRDQIEQRLRSGFEIEDTDGILDAILGPEG